jgi:tRNA pseudouridine38-40 synthase
MARYQVILAYEGTRFRGFQRQLNRLGAQTVQGVFETALQQLGWQGTALLAAGRTDTGVHASGQVIAFDLEWKHRPDELRDALNAHLPAEVVVQTVRAVHPGFHPRYDAVSRRYRYSVYCREVPDPLLERYAWRVWPALNLDTMQLVCSLLLGRHDFAAFGTPPRAGGSTIRTVLAADWKPDGTKFLFEIVGDAFLYRMVRRLVFIQVAVGQGRLAVEQVHSYLESPPPHPLQGLAPPNGLVLVEVTYPAEKVGPG